MSGKSMSGKTVSGKVMSGGMLKIIVHVKDGFQVTIDQAMECAGKLAKNQSFYRLTRGAHAALIFDTELKDLSFAEDVGRHNALDKAIGSIVMNGTLPKAGLLVMSSRVSYELVQKAARAKISTIVSISRPTSMAVQMAKGLNMTLACAFESKKLLILCGEQRIIR